MTIAEAIAVAEARSLLWHVTDKPAGLQPWDKVRWAKLLRRHAHNLQSAGIQIPSPDDAIAAYHRHPRFLADLQKWTAEWSEIAAQYHAPHPLTIALQCLSQWHPQITLYSETLQAINRGKKLTEANLELLIKAMKLDHDLLRLAKLPLPDVDELIDYYHRQTLKAGSINVDLTLDKTWIAATFKYDPGLQPAIKYLAKLVGSSKPWNPTKKCWQFPARSLSTVIQYLPDAQIDPALQCKLLEQRDRAQRIAALRQQAIAALDSTLTNGGQLFRHQVEGARLIAERPVIVADDMGLGKTIMSLAVAKAFKAIARCPVIAIVPASLKDNWKREAELVGVEIEVYSWAKIPAPPEVDFVAIADEAHFAQAGGKTARGKKFLDLTTSDRCIAAIPMTGTPMKNGRPIELLPLLQAIAHPIAENVRGYELRYCAAGYKSIPVRNSDGMTRSVWDNSGAANMDDLHRQIKGSMLRRHKSQCLDLPEKMRVLRPVELSPAAAKRYRDEFAESQARYLQRVAAGEISGDSEAMVELAHLRHAASHAKIETAIALAEEAIAQNQSIVLFTEFATTANELDHELRSRNHQTVLLTGATKQSDRQSLVDQFQSGAAPVFIGTIRAGGVGLTLTQSSIVVLVDRPWTPGDAEQAEDRCYRIGTKSNVLALWLQCGELDRRVDAVLAKKSDVIELVLQGKRKTLRGVTDPRKAAKAIADTIFKAPVPHNTI